MSHSSTRCTGRGVPIATVCHVLACAFITLFAIIMPFLPATDAILVLPETPPRGWNSFDLQRYNQTMNEALFRHTASAMATQLLPHGYDTIVIDGGWSRRETDEYGRNVPDKTLFPSSANGAGFKPLARYAHSLGLKVGVWKIRGVLESAVDSNGRVKGTDYTLADIVVNQSSCTGRWCKCTWDDANLGINTSHPAAQAYYNSIVELMAEWELVRIISGFCFVLFCVVFSKCFQSKKN